MDNRRKSPMRPGARMDQYPGNRMNSRQETRKEGRMDSRAETLPETGTDCPCAEQPSCMVLAMAYVPMQKFEDLYNPEVGFDRGTVFCRLDLPYLGEPLPGEEDCCYD